jgi:hypothetical protein
MRIHFSRGGDLAQRLLIILSTLEWLTDYVFVFANRQVLNLLWGTSPRKRLR